MKHAAIALLLMLALPLAAATPEPERIDACALLDAAQIERAIGHAVEPGARDDAGMESNGAWSSSCVWAFTQQAGEPQGRRFVILNAMQWPPGSGRAHEFLDSFREAAASGVLARQPSARAFGDEALWWGDGLAVRKRDASFGLSVFWPRSPAKTPGLLEERLAPLVLSRLDRHQAALSKH
ncbi:MULTISPECIES: hypothetical protein [Hydrocarboniphaga]|uniref:Uncharacterized protein n=1 Tax=Hydrocarboniphaga effusa AP103 TaxID=1172194 RepID=I7ZGR1_9GAMM|nr:MULTISPECIES: hypothetical protein [Hydrocarboniphaga]EIT70917.1 hypothetical protein WQQ_10540 [Hydrocarboniphaga effusa AP103]MDZ4077826.1 hypothetical protein [Hydrocarboniphaga sp.]